MKIVVIIQNPFINLYESLLHEIQRRSDLQLVFVVFPLGDSTMHTITEIAEYLRSKGIAYELGINPENGEVLDVLTLEPDLVIYQTPYDAFRAHRITRATRIGRWVPITHISYGTTFIEYDKVHSGLISKNRFQKCCWKIFIENSLVEKQMNDIVPDKYQSIGYIKCAKYIEDAQPDTPAYNWPGDAERPFRVVWKPRWTASLGKSNLLKYLYPFLDYAKENPDISFVLYGHPLLEVTMTTKTQVATAAAWQEIIAAFEALPNARLELSGDFLDCVMSADLFIGDYSSTLAEFYLTGRPVIYTPLDVTLSLLGRKMAEGWYEANSFGEIVKTIHHLKRGDDPLADARNTLKELVSTPLDAQVTIAEGFCNYLVAQFADHESGYWKFRKNLRANPLVVAAMKCRRACTKTIRLIIPPPVRSLIVKLFGGSTPSHTS